MMLSYVFVSGREPQIVFERFRLEAANQLSELLYTEFPSAPLSSCFIFL